MIQELRNSLTALFIIIVPLFIDLLLGIDVAFPFKVVLIQDSIETDLFL